MNLDDIPDDNAPWLLGYRIDPINRTVTVASFAPPLADVLRGRHWAHVQRGQGWTFPARYLAHVERLLAGANAELFDIDGRPTPNHADADRAEQHAHTQRLLTEIRAARDAANTPAAARARAECRKAFGLG